MDLSTLAARLGSRLQWRLSTGDTPTKAELLDAIRAHPDFGPAFANALAKGGGKRGARRKLDRWAKHLSLVRDVSVSEADYRRAGNPHARRDAIQDTAVEGDMNYDTIRRKLTVPWNAPLYVRSMHRSLREYARTGGVETPE